jgi:amidase
MTNGSALLAGYVPDFDATAITRILDAGGEIAGKSACEDHSLGLGYNSVTGRVSNPHNPKFSAGGSSSGSAALVAAGEVDVAMGGDQGGSIRIPSSLCGVYGLKPTHGLVPYTGIMGHDHVLDHAGPMGPNVRNVALLLEVVAGRDGLDPRQPTVVPTEAYSERVSKGVRGVRIGVLREGFGFPASEKEVDAAVEAAAAKLGDAGAVVRNISIPMHRDGYQIFSPIFVEGGANHVGRELGVGTGWKGFYPTSLLDAYGRARQAFSSQLSDLAMGIITSGHYMQTRYYGRYYAKAMNIARTLEAAYDAALAEVDLLLLPTTPRRSGEHVMDSTRAELIASGRNLSPNTCVFDVTGHPAMNVPCGKEGGLPIGMMLVGRHFEDGLLLQAAATFESLGVYAGLSKRASAQ